jgi:hypothetical protein
VAFGNAPDHVNRTPVPVELPDKDTWSLGVFGIVLDHDRGRNTVEHVTDKDTVFRHLVVSVSRDAHVSGSDQVDDPAQGVCHLLMSSAA